MGPVKLCATLAVVFSILAWPDFQVAAQLTMAGVGLTTVWQITALSGQGAARGAHQPAGAVVKVGRVPAYVAFGNHRLWVINDNTISEADTGA